MTDQLHPYEIMYHPECQRVSKEIHKRKHSIVWNKYGSGGGASMFVRTHMDIYYNPSGSLCMLLDDDTTTTELFAMQKGLLEGTWKFVIIDLAVPWTIGVLRMFLKKVHPKIKIVIVSPSPIHEIERSYVIEVKTTCPNENYTFLQKNIRYFRYLKNTTPRQYFEYHVLFKGNLSRLMQKFYLDSVSAELEVDPYVIRTLTDAERLFEQQKDFDFTNYGNIEWRAFVLEIRSLCDIKSSWLISSSDSDDHDSDDHGDNNETPIFYNQFPYETIKAMCWYKSMN